MVRNTRFTGKINLLDLPALKAAVPQFSDQQLEFYLKLLTRNQIFNVQRHVVLDEFEHRTVVAATETYGRCR